MPTSPYQFGVEDTEKLVYDMHAFMIDNKGVGLAAPQIGRQESFFIMAFGGIRHNIFNPTILTYGPNNIIYQEGCLSFPDLFISVLRPDTVEIRYQNERGDWLENRFEEFFARIAQHEFDHLQGICFVDKVSKLALDMAKRKRQKALRKHTRE